MDRVSVRMVPSSAESDRLRRAWQSVEEQRSLGDLEYVDERLQLFLEAREIQARWEALGGEVLLASIASDGLFQYWAVAGQFVWIYINPQCEVLKGLYDGYDPSIAPGQDLFNDCILVAMRRGGAHTLFWCVEALIFPHD